MNRRPNIVLILCDDLAWGDVAAHGNAHLRTPNMDRLHAEGSHLTRYCSGPLCSPGRASVMTGRYHLRTRVLDTYCGRSIIDPDERTIAALLREAGYRTGAFGKWHLGDNYPSRACDLGFEDTLMHLAGGIGQPGDHIENFRRRETQNSYFDAVYHRNGVPEQSRGYCTDVFADETIRFIREHRDEPFFAYLAPNAPHSPFEIDERWVEPYRRMGVCERHARVYGMVENIDMNVGRVLGVLDELGLAEDTIVIFTSDHGPCGSADDPEAEGESRIRFNGGLRGKKGTLYEGGIRVPSLWRWPRRFDAGRDVDRLAHAIDMLPTLLEVAGVPLPDDRVIDGVSLLPLLTGQNEADPWPDREVFMQWHRGNMPVPRRNAAVITQQYKWYSVMEDQEAQLFDLEADPHEQHDLAGAMPDLATAMGSRYEAWLDEVGATRGPGTFDPQLIHLGTPHENPTFLSRNDWRLVDQEGWQRDDLRGVWHVKVTQGGPYAVTVRHRNKVPAGRVVLRVNDQTWTAAADEDEREVRFEDLMLPVGPGQVEAWRELDEPREGAFRGRFLPSMGVLVAH